MANKILDQAHESLICLQTAVEIGDWQSANKTIDQLRDLHYAAQNLTDDEWKELELIMWQKNILAKSIPWFEVESWYRRAL